MRMIVKTFIGITLVGMIVLGARWWYFYEQYRQDLPTRDIVIAGIQRQYHIYVPDSVADQPAEIIVLLQGGDAGSWIFPQQDLWESLADERGMILAVPIGMIFGDNEGAWQLNTGPLTMQDIQYISGMLDDISIQYEIEPARVFAVGYSLGSMFSYELACQMSGRFAAIASFAGTMPVVHQSCNLRRHVPIMHIHGTEDPIIQYHRTWDWKAWDSVGTMRDIPSLIQYWAGKYGCSEIDEIRSENVIKLQHSSCQQNVTVEHFRLVNGGHSWPKSIGEVSTHSLIWSFLDRFEIKNEITQ